MQKDQVYEGMILKYEYCKVLVVEKCDKYAKVLWLSTGEVEDVQYNELSTLPGNQLYRSYNSRIREQASRYNGKFCKNDDKVFEFESGEGVWFTSDTHFYHENIIRFCDRPFKTVEEMNQALIDRWNSVVKPDDTVFHLGDFCWGGSAAWEGILQQLNGHIHLIIGNHDVKNLRQGYMKYFESVSFQKQIKVEGQSIYLNHYPFLTYGGIYRKEPVWQLFGHVHSNGGQGGADSGRLQHLLRSQYDVGVDNNNFTPISFEQVKQVIESQGQIVRESTVKNEEIEHLKLKNDILLRLLTPEQRAQYDEMTIDKGE